MHQVTWRAWRKQTVWPLKCLNQLVWVGAQEFLSPVIPQVLLVLRVQRPCCETPLLEGVVLLSTWACLPTMICKPFAFCLLALFFFFSLPLAEGVGILWRGVISDLPPMYSWSQQRDQYVVDAPWIPEGLRRAEGRRAARQSSHFRDPCGILAGGPGRTWVSFSSPVEISCIQSG